MDLLWDLDEVLEEFLDALPGEVKIDMLQLLLLFWMRATYTQV